MHKQRTLPLAEEISLETIWEHLPQRNRQELVTLYARLMAHVAIEGCKSSSNKEPVDEKTNG